MDSNTPRGRWLTYEDFNKINNVDLIETARLIREGVLANTFPDSTHYDVLLDDGTRLAPKALFGLAARRVLKEDVHPSQFKGGEGTPCFRVIRNAGFRIVPKTDLHECPMSRDEARWIEGEPRRQWHLVFERKASAVNTKKRVFREAHNGRLECERCGLVPSNLIDGMWSESCIEVHHKIPLSEFGRRETTLNDLMCVCANCHRVLHQDLR